MNDEREILRTAWSDGELSSDEQAAFLAGLSEDERRDLDDEKRLDDGIASLLAAPAPCPAPVWQRAADDVLAAAAAKSRVGFDFQRMVLMAAPIAAVVVVAFALFVPAGSDATPTFLKVAGATVPELEQCSEVRPEYDQVEHFMRQYGFNLRLSEVRLPANEVAQGRTLRLVGAQTASYRGETVMILFFACCNKPAQMVVTLRGGEAERAILSAHERQAVLVVRELCPQYMGAVVGDTDRANQLLALLTTPE